MARGVTFIDVSVRPGHHAHTMKLDSAKLPGVHIAVGACKHAVAASHAYCADVVIVQLVQCDGLGAHPRSVEVQREKGVRQNPLFPSLPTRVRS